VTQQVCGIVAAVSTAAWLWLPPVSTLQRQGGAAAETDRVLAAGSTSDLAAFLATHGMSAGVVASRRGVRTPANPGNAQERAEQWLDDSLVPADDVLRPLTVPLSAEPALVRFAAARGGRLLVDRRARVPVLTDPDATVCGRVLEQPVGLDVAAATISEAVSALANAVSPDSAYRGFVGTCWGVGDSGGRFHIPVGHSLGSALSAAAGSTSGIVWFAVDNGLGGCSLGIVQRRLKGTGTCRVVVAPDVR
jgi:hypothetical protein